jgi:FAD/FMN-containing dehydrogenase
MTGDLYGGPWTMWDDAADDAANIAWHDEAMRLLRPYVAETDTVAHPEFARLSFAPANWQQLAQLRQQHDPDGRFFDFTEGLG